LDAALVNGEMAHAVAVRFGLSRWSIENHRKNHLAPELIAVLAERRRAGIRHALHEFERQADRLDALRRRAEKRGDAKLVELLGDVRKEIVSIADLAAPRAKAAR
jgi:hypothetical protein